MSKQIDERVVSMQFDNKHFESNVKTTMSTLDKLKAKLNLSGASKGLENVSHAARKVDMHGLGNSVDTVRSRFSALEVMGVTALANITNSAVNAGKRIVSALTIDPVKTGFNEYELKMNSVQTIMASTGETLETVNGYLDELNEYSDKTIYSFSDMTQNIGKFTNAGVKLKDSVAAIQGIANVAAVSGANANEASRAMYNFSQALSSGYVKLIDWKSIELANMATVEFKEQLIASAVEMGTLKKASNGMYRTLDGNLMNATKNFNDTLQDQWMTSEVLIKTLGKYTDETTEIGKKATEAATKVKTFTQLLDTLKESAQSGWARTWEIIFGDFDEGTNLWTRISKSVGGFIDKTSEARNKMLEGAFGSSGSKWDTFNKKIEEAGVKTEDFGEKLKEVAKEEGYAVDDLIEKHGSLTNAISKGALSKDLIVKTLRKMADGESKAAETTENMTDKLEYFQKVVNEVWHGDYANGAARIKALEEAGYDYATVQALVNKTVDGHKLTLDDLSDVQLKNIGYTDKQIKAIRELADEAEKTGTPLNELIDSLDKPSGRELLIESLANAFKGLGTVLASVKKAWNAIFHPGMSEDEIISEKSSRLYKLTESLNAFSKKLVVNEETARLWVKTFKGVFALLDIIATLVMGPIKVAFELFKAILEVCDVSILQFTAGISHYIVVFRNWLKSLIDFRKIAEKVVEFFHKMVDAFKKWGSAAGDASDIAKDFIQGLINGFKNGLGKLVEFVKNIGTTIIDTVKDVLGIHSPSTEGKEIGKNFILGIVYGIKGFMDVLWETIKGIFEYLLVGLPKNALYCASVFIDYLAQGLITGLKKVGEVLVYGFEKLLNNASNILSGIKKDIVPIIVDGILALGDFLAKIIPDIVEIFSTIGGAIREAIKKIDFKAVMKEIGKGLASGISLLVEIGIDSVKGFAQGLKEGSPAVFKAIDDFIQDAKKFLEERSIGFAEIMTGAIVAGILLALGQVLALLGSVRGVLGGVKDVLKSVDGVVDQTRKLIKSASKILSGVALTMVSKALINFSIAILILVASMAAVALIPKEDFTRAAVTVGALIGVVLAMMITLTVLSKNMLSAKNMDEFKEKAKAFAGVRTIFISLGLALLAIAGAIAIVGKMDPKEMLQGSIVVAILMAALFGIMMSTKLLDKIDVKTQLGTIDQIGPMIMKIVTALLIAAVAIKMLGKLDPNEAKQGSIIAGGFLVAVFGLMVSTKLLNKYDTSIERLGMLDKVGPAVMKIAFALLIMAVGMKLIASMEWHEIGKAGLVAGVFIGAVVGLMAATKLLQTDTTTVDKTGIKQVGKMVLNIALALLVMAVGMKLIASMEWDEIKKAGLVAGVFIGAVVGLMAATNLIKKGTWGNGSEITKFGVMVLSIAGALTLMAIAMVVLGNMELSKVIQGGLAAAALCVVVAGLMAATKLLTKDEQSAKSMMKVGVMILAISAALILMSAAIVILSKLDPDRMWPAVGALAILAACVALLMGVSKLAEKVKIGTIVMITVMVAVLATALGLLSLIDPKRLNAPMLALGVLMIIMGVLMGLSKLINNNKGVIGTMITLTVMVAVLAGALWLLSTMNPDGLITKVAALVALLTVMVVMGAVLGKLGQKAGSIALGTLAISLLLIPLAGIAAILTLMDKVSIGEIMTKVLALSAMLLVMVGVAAILGVMGGMIATIALGALAISILLVPIAGIALILGLMKDMTIDTVMTKVLALSAMLLVMVGVAAILGVMGGMVGAIALGTLAISLLLIPLAGIAAILTLMDDMDIGTAMTKVLALSATLVALVGIGALIGLAAPLLLPALLVLIPAVALLPVLGTNLREFVTNLGTFTDAQVATVNCAVNALVGMSKAFENVVPDSLWAFFGADQFTKFLAMLPGTATAINAFISNIGTFGNDQINTVMAATNAVKNMAQAFDGVTPDSLFEFFGNNKFEKFLKALPDFAEHMNKFMEKMQAFDTSTINSVNAAVGAVKAFSALKDVDVGDLKTKMSGLGDGMISFAGKIQSFVSKLNEVGSGTITTASSNISLLVSTCQNMQNVNPETISNFGVALGSLGEADVESFVNAVNGASETVIAAGGKLVDSLATGATNSNDTAVNAINGVVGNAASAVASEGNIAKFYSVGVSLVSGFIAGIGDNIESAANKAAAMARAAAAAAEAELDINSPSKVFRAIGTAIPEGFAMGIDKLSGTVTASSVSMADDAVFTVTDSVSRISDMIDSDIDTQPTIRPVLDLSEIKAGANGLDGLFDTRASVGLMTNINAISSSMGRQNGVNDDLVSEIRAMRKDLNNLERPSYVINGVTYDDGSNITEAVQTIVRAARIERRT